MGTEDPPHINAGTLTQLALIREIDTIFSQADLPFWIRGGWAVDFLLGRITRSHSDIDLVSWRRHSSKIRDLLTLADFAYERDIGVQMDFTKTGQDVSIVFIAKNEAGQIFTPDIPEWTWRVSSLSWPVCRLRDLSCCVISPEQMLDEKASYEQGTVRSLRPKDVHSIATLRQYIAEN